MRGIRAAKPGDANPFDRRTMLVLAGAGVLAFVAMLILGAYAPDLRSGKNGGAHALSNAATGYSGLVRLAEATNRNPQVVRQKQLLDSEDLLVATPESDRINLDDLLSHRQGKATLIVLPKWQAERDGKRPSWVRIRGLLPNDVPAGVLAPANDLTVVRLRTERQPLGRLREAPPELVFYAPRLMQAADAGDMRPIVTDANGHVIVGELGETRLYVLTDPDLINNHGIADVRQARAAMALLDFLAPTDSSGVMFDVTLNGFGASRSPLRLAFDPPFLGVTIAIFIALLLAGFQAIYRFGPERRPDRALAFGKAALVDNSALLVRRAGREARLGQRYAALVRERALARLRLSAGDEATAQRLDELPSSAPYSKLAAAAASARTREEAFTAAKRLHQWIQEIDP